MNSEIIVYRDKKIAFMREDPLELNNFVKSDLATAEDYAGREVFELMQNAVDVGSQVKIELADDTLIISNSGEPFSTDSIEALMVPNNSTKTNESDLMGYKGVGFRASLNISDDIRVYSGNFHLRFSKEIAQRIQKEYRLEQAPPMMRCPEETEDTYKNEYTTNIFIKLRDANQAERVKHQMLKIKEDTILFLKDGFERLEIIIDEEKNTFSRTIKTINENEALVTINHNKKSKTFREFFKKGVFGKDYGNVRENEYRLAVIYSPEKIEDNKLYSFFRTDIDFPMDYWYAHGNFSLINNRNQLVKKERNSILMKWLIQLICNSATKISDTVDYTGYKVLKSHRSFSSSILEDIDLNDILEREINNALIMPTVNNEYISLNSRPVFYNLNLQKFLLNMPRNNSLLQYTNDEEIVSYLEKDTKTYDLEVVSEHIKNTLSDMSNDDRIFCAKLLYQYYGNNDKFANIAPDFFTDKEKNTVKNGSILIKPSLELTLPSFIELKYIDEEQLNLIKKYLGVYSDEALVSTGFGKTYGIRIANINEILDIVDRLIKDNTKLIPNYVRWLYDNREIIRGSSHDNFYLLTKNGEIRRANNSYFGKEYIEGTSLEKFYNSSKIIAKPSVFHIEPDELADFTIFLKEKLNVADYPRIRSGIIEDLETILERGSTKYILILMHYYQNELCNYMSFADTRNKFKENKWITRKGKRYAPKDVILTSKRNYHKISNYLKDDFLFISQDELLSTVQMEDWVKTWLIDYLDFNTELYELDNEQIYKILNELPDFDPRGEISEDVYKDIIINNEDRTKPDTNLPEFSKFINSGKVFCQDKAYHNVKECLYLKEKYPNIIESKYKFINIVKNKSPEAIWDRFRIKPLSVNYSLHKYAKAKSNTIDFTNDLNNFKVSLFVENEERFEDEKRLDSLRNISITLCDSIGIKYDENNGELEDYEFVNEDEKFYIKVPDKSFAELKNNDKFQDAMSEAFRTIYKFLDKDGTARAIGRDVNSRIDRAKDEYGNNAWAEAEAKLDLLSSQNKDHSSENLEILINLRNKYFEEYEKRLYTELKNAATKDKINYVNKLFEYRNRNFIIEEIPKEKDANMLNYLYGLYPILNRKAVKAQDIDKDRKEAYCELRKEFSDYIDVLNQLLEDNRFESLLRFGELTQIRKEMYSNIEKIKKIQTAPDDTNGQDGTEKKSPDSTNTKDGNKSSKQAKNNPESNHDESKKQQLGKSGSRSLHFSYHNKEEAPSDVTFVNFNDVKSKVQTGGGTNNHYSSKRMPISSKKTLEKRAKEAEKIALTELEKKGYKNIQWMSAYAKEENINPNGADGYGYDIQCEKEGELRYIEVKSSLSSTGIEFEMTENELSFCSQHPKNYDIVYVYGRNSEPKKITIIENVFSKINDSNKSPASYRITLK